MPTIRKLLDSGKTNSLSDYDRKSDNDEDKIKNQGQSKRHGQDQSQISDQVQIEEIEPEQIVLNAEALYMHNAIISSCVPSESKIIKGIYL